MTRSNGQKLGQYDMYVHVNDMVNASNWMIELVFFNNSGQFHVSFSYVYLCMLTC